MNENGSENAAIGSLYLEYVLLEGSLVRDKRRDLDLPFFFKHAQIIKQYFSQVLLVDVRKLRENEMKFVEIAHFERCTEVIVTKLE